MAGPTPSPTPTTLPSPRAALREATRRTLAARRVHLVYGAFVGILGALVFAPAASWIFMQATAAAAGGSVVNYAISDLVLSFRGLLLFVLWSVLIGAAVVIAAGGHAWIAGAEGAGARPRLRDVMRHVIVALPRVPGRGAARIALLAAAGLPLIAAATAALAGLMLLPLQTGEDLRDVVPRGLPVPLWMVAAGMAVLFLVFAWLYVRWSLAIPSLMLEGTSLTEATKRSARRIRGSFWKVAAAHLRHHVTMALLFALLFGLLRLLGRPILTAFQEKSPEQTGLALSLLLAASYLLAGALWILGVARLVTLTVVHHVALGGSADRIGAVEADAASPRIRLGAALIGGMAAAIFVAATALTIPKVEEELRRAARHATITAHRGSSLDAPENTLAAIRGAIEARADMAEIDVQQAKDGTIVVIHDANLKRLAGVDGNVWELTYDELAKLDVGSHFSPKFANERIPTLEQALDLARDHIKLNIELKTNKHETEAFVPDVVALLRRKDFFDRCIITSLEMPLLTRVRQIEPRLKIGAIITAKVGSESGLDVDLYSVQPLIATSEFIRRAHREGREVHVWTVNERVDVQRFADRGADGLITDAPRLAREVIDARTAKDGLAGAAKRLLGRDW